MRICQLEIVLLSFAAGPSGALADVPPAADVPSVAINDSAEAEADQLLQEVFQLRQAKDDERALQKAQQAYALHPVPWVLVHLSLAESGMGQSARAYRHLRRALRDRDDPRIAQFADALQAELRRLEARVFRLNLEIEPAGARVLVNGDNQGAAPLVDGAVVEAGTIVLDVRAAGFAPHVVSFEGAAGEQMSRTIKLSPLPLEPAAPVALRSQPLRALPTAQSERTDSSTAGYVLSAATVVLVAGAIVTSVMAVDRAAEFDAKNHDTAFNEAQRVKARKSALAMQWISTGVWANAVLCGGISAYVLFSSPGDERASAAGRGVMLGARGRF